MGQQELFTVEYDGGEMLDKTGDGGFTVWLTRQEAQDAADSVTEDIPLTVVRYVREASNA